MSQVRSLKNIVFLLMALQAALCLSGQSRPIARFSFNKGSDREEVSGNKAKLVNARPSADRFGNEDHAVFVSGNDMSYINLGTAGNLKPNVGTISMWVKIERDIYAGVGSFYNPVIVTKQWELDDFFESYCIYYFPANKKFVFASCLDSLAQPLASSKEGDFTNHWTHLAISYDSSAMSLYVNGQLEDRLPRHFSTRFLAGDSVVVGHSANKKNLRFFYGSVDDIEFYDHVLSDAEVMDRFLAPDPNKNAIVVRWVLISLGAVLLVIGTYFYTRYRVKKAGLIEKQKLEQANTALENELRVHRALMNPHFIFNTLNGLHDLILKKEYDGASDYLVKFSELLRKILESNMSDVITLEMEVELLRRYIEIEDLRFEERFTYSILIDSAISPSNTIIPIMMLQPFVENAIWHGLRVKEGDKSIRISFTPQGEKHLQCVIEDNGVGWHQTNEYSEKKSLATKFIRQRLNLLNKLHDLNCCLFVEDPEQGSGLRVTIILPVLNGYY